MKQKDDDEELKDTLVQRVHMNIWIINGKETKVKVIQLI